MSTQAEPSSAAQRSLYRRHRPRSFAEVVGQEPVVRTLRNAVEQDKVHHAYLFVGSRGTGKTSMAKILAACLNCERGRTVEPCGVCESCVAIAEARSMEVIEMDAASNNSVEDIRELRESVAFQPLAGRAKVYILDEAHMLSTAAWNAFLKTLEEPPPSTVFVLATTEADKVPATVVDRCHRFDFQRPTVEQVATVLSRTAAAEAISIPPEALAALAKAAGGSFRDALGTLEQLVTYGGPEVSLDDVLAVLGLAGSQQLEETLDAVAGGDAAGVLGAVERCVAAGREVSMFASDLERRARELMVVQVLGGVPDELALTLDADARLLAQAGRIAAPSLVALLDLLAVAAQTVRAGGDPRTQLELALLKAARPELDPTVKALQARIERLEGGGPVSAAPAGGAAAGDGGADRPTDLGGSAVSAPPSAVPPAPPQAAQPPARQPQQRGEPAADPVAAPAAPAPAPVSAPAPPPAPEPPVQPMPPAPAPAPAQAVPPAAAPAVPAPADGVDAIREAWPAIVESVRAGNALLGALMDGTLPVDLRDGELTVAFPAGASFNRKKADTAGNRAEVAAAVRALTGTGVSLAYEMREQDAAAQVAAGGDGEEDMVSMVIRELGAEELSEDGAAEHVSGAQEGQ